MQLVGADGYRSSVTNDVPLVKDESDRDRDREDRYGDPRRWVLDGDRQDQPPDRFRKQQHRAADDKGGLPQDGERLRLAMAKAVLAVGRAHRVADRKEIDQRGDRV